MSSSERPIIVVAHDPGWAACFREIGANLRRSLGPVALRIDHVGSTAVEGLDAKPVIDVQISVVSLDLDDAFAPPLRALGYEHRPENPDRTKRFFRGSPNGVATHVHVRVRGCFDEQLNLLFRDFLRSSPAGAAEYARVKRALAERFRNDREGYVRAKEPEVWSLLQRAHDWAQSTGWAPGPSDA